MINSVSVPTVNILCYDTSVPLQLHSQEHPKGKGVMIFSGDLAWHIYNYNGYVVADVEHFVVYDFRSYLGWGVCRRVGSVSFLDANTGL